MSKLSVCRLEDAPCPVPGGVLDPRRSSIQRSLVVAAIPPNYITSFARQYGPVPERAGLRMAGGFAPLDAPDAHPARPSRSVRRLLAIASIVREITVWMSLGFTEQRLLQ
jgi:hypothetical protein